MSYDTTNTQYGDFKRDEIREYYDSVLRESTKPRRTKKRMTVAEIRRDTFEKICKTLLPVTLAIGIGIGGLGFSFIDRTLDSWDENAYLGDQIEEFRADYINPNTHRTQDNNGYWYDYLEISKGIENASNQDEAIFYCYENIGSLQTGRVIVNVGYDTFMDYIQSKGFTTLEEYEDFMRKEVSLRHQNKSGKDELNEMMNEHSITDDGEVNSIGGK